MSDTWTERFNLTHVPAGSATGGQFGTSSGGSTAAKGGAKAPAKAKAAPPAHKMSPAHAAEKAKLLAQARKDAQEAAALEKTLTGLEKQHAAAVTASKKSAASAAAAKKAGHIVHHRKHAAHHTAHHKHAASLKQRITSLKGRIHTLRVQAAGLEKQANAIRSGDTPDMSDTWVRRESDLKYGHGSALWKYWTRGEGFAKWSGAAHKWTTLRDLLLKAGVPSISADGLTTNIIMAVMPGYMKLAHAKAGHQAGRAAMATDTKAKPYGNVTYADPKNSKYPIDSEAHCRAAWSYINMPKNAAMYPLNGVTLSEVKDRIKAALKKYGADVSSDNSSASRTAPLEYFRTYELEDIHVVRAAQGDSTGRLVEAYAAVFNSPAEIHDHEGHYVEEIDPAAFNKVVADIGRSRAGFGKVKVIFNHGLTIHGTPSERGSMPIGRAMEIRPEERGLLTLTRYSETPFADEVLENIRNGAITAQSFTGRIVRSDPELRRGQKHYPRNGQLPQVRRTELGLKEFGPTPFEAYSGAEIVGVRMSTPGTWEPDEQEQQDEALPPDEEAAAGEPLTRTYADSEEHSARYHQHALFVLRSKEAREKAGLVF